MSVWSSDLHLNTRVGEVLAKLALHKFKHAITLNFLDRLVSLIFPEFLHVLEHLGALILLDNGFCIVEASAVVKYSEEMLLFLGCFHRHWTIGVNVKQFESFGSTMSIVFIGRLLSFP